MTTHSVSNTTAGQSPWQALQDLRHKSQDQGTDSTSPIDAFFSAPASPTAPAAANTSANTSTSTADGTNAPPTNAANMDSAVSQLIAGLQSFLLNLSSGTGSASTDASTAIATTAGDSSTGSGSTSTTTASNTQPDGTNGPNAQSLDANMLSAIQSYAAQFDPTALQGGAMSINA